MDLSILYKSVRSNNLGYGNNFTGRWSLLKSIVKIDLIDTGISVQNP